MEDYQIFDIINSSGVRITVGKSIPHSKWLYLRDIIVTKIYIKQIDQYESAMFFDYKIKEGNEFTDRVCNVYNKTSE